MRALILIAGALAVSACGKSGQADNTLNADDNLTAENIVSNDVTAIDAVTGDAANMAADVDVNFTNEQLATTNESAAAPSPRTKAPGKPPLETPTPANAVTNNAE